MFEFCTWNCVCTNFMQGRHGESEPGKFQYSTPKFFDWLFLIRAYLNPKSWKGPNLPCLPCCGGPVMYVVQNVNGMSHFCLIEEIMGQSHNIKPTNYLKKEWKILTGKINLNPCFCVVIAKSYQKFYVTWQQGRICILSKRACNDLFLPFQNKSKQNWSYTSFLKTPSEPRLKKTK